MSQNEIREALLTYLSQPKTEDVTDKLPELSHILDGRRVYVRELSAPELVAWHRENYTRKSADDLMPDDATARLVILATIWEDGSRVFLPEDTKVLMQSSSIVSRLHLIASRLCGLIWREDDLGNAQSTLLSNGRRQGEVPSPTSCFAP